jgi:hypothetical protein
MLLLLLIAILTAGIGYYMNQRYSLEKRHTLIPEKRYKNKVLRIGVIGDSWAAGVSLDTIISNEFSRRGVPVEIISFGAPEAKSKDVYENLYAQPGIPYSSNKILHHNLDYCIILTGTSDAAGKMGAKFYAYYSSLIISDLLKDKIKPVFVTMPDFGFKETLDSLSIFKKARNAVSALIVNNGSTGNLEDYRIQLNEVLKDTHLKDSIIMVPFALVTDNYEKNKNLYRNKEHLSMAGKQKMGKIIVQFMVKRMNNNADALATIPPSGG